MSNPDANGTPQEPHWRAYLFLTLTALCWGGNAIFGKLAVGEVSPMALVGLRWLGVMILVILFMRRTVQRDWPVLKNHLVYLFAMGALGFTIFNALFYVAAHYTSALNIGILQGSIPVFVLLGVFVVYRTPITPLQILGVLVTLVGVVMVASGGDMVRLAGSVVNLGDLFMILACMLYAGYAVGLQRRPDVSPLSVFAILAFSALLVSVPLMALEYAMQDFMWPTARGWLIVALVILFPSMLAQLAFMQGVSMIGPGRAGIFVNLVPVFASILAVIVLQEQFRWFHGMALTLVLGGIALSERGKRRTKTPGRDQPPGRQ